MANQGEYKEAEQHLKEALKFREMVLSLSLPLPLHFISSMKLHSSAQVVGPNSVSLVSILNNLGMVYKRQENFPECEKCFRR